MPFPSQDVGKAGKPQGTRTVEQVTVCERRKAIHVKNVEQVIELSMDITAHSEVLIIVDADVDQWRQCLQQFLRLQHYQSQASCEATDWATGRAELRQSMSKATFIIHQEKLQLILAKNCMPHSWGGPDCHAATTVKRAPPSNNDMIQAFSSLNHF